MSHRNERSFVCSMWYHLARIMNVITHRRQYGYLCCHLIFFLSFSIKGESKRDLFHVSDFSQPREVVNVIMANRFFFLPFEVLNGFMYFLFLPEHGTHYQLESSIPRRQENAIKFHLLQFTRQFQALLNTLLFSIPPQYR